MTTSTTAPDAALLWARERCTQEMPSADFASGKFDHVMHLRNRAEAFRAGQSHADAGLLAALEGLVNAVTKRTLHGRSHVPSMRDEQHAMCAARAAIAAAKGQTMTETNVDGALLPEDCVLVPRSLLASACYIIRLSQHHSTRTAELIRAASLQPTHVIDHARHADAGLLPCAHCGSADVEIRTSLTDELIACNNCGARTGLIWLCDSEAVNAKRRRQLVAAWNRRAGQSHADAGLLAALERMVYETTHLSPMKSNGDHDCTIKADALAQARAALGEQP